MNPGKFIGEANWSWQWCNIIRLFSKFSYYDVNWTMTSRHQKLHHQKLVYINHMIKGCLNKAYYIVETDMTDTPWPQLWPIWVISYDWDAQKFLFLILIRRTWVCDGIKTNDIFCRISHINANSGSSVSQWDSQAHQPRLDRFGASILGTPYIIQVVHVWIREAKPFICQGLNFDRTDRKCSTLRFNKVDQGKRILTIQHYLWIAKSKYSN